MEVTTSLRQFTLKKRVDLPHWGANRVSHPRSMLLSLSVLIVLSVVFIAVCAPVIAPYDPAKMSPADRLQPPTAAHLFGTDLYGRDLFSRVLYGARLSLTVAALAVLVGALPGISGGVLAGMYPGLLENIVSRLVDAWIAVPSLLLAIVMAASFGRSAIVVALALGVASIPTFYRQARAETLRVRSAAHIGAARALGAREEHILFHHVLPNVLPGLLVLVTLRLGGMLLAVSALSFIGLGAQPPEPEWGALLAEGREYLEQAWWLTFFPGCAIALTVFGLNLFGDSLRDRLDPAR